MMRVAKEGGGLRMATVSPLKAHDGHLVGASMIMHDITERKRAEEALERTAEELARSNKDLEQFAYVASHDLQEPLRMVTSYLQLLDRRYKDKLDEDADEFIDFAVDGATRMQPLINDLLAYSRVGTRGRPLEPVDIGRGPGSAPWPTCRPPSREAGRTITHDPLPTVLADATAAGPAVPEPDRQRHQVPRAGPPAIHVCVAAERRTMSGSSPSRDNGIGIEPQYAETIFLIFQRLHSRGEYPGTGIGLAICKKIVERHGGRIWVEVQPGRGLDVLLHDRPDRRNDEVMQHVSKRQPTLMATRLRSCWSKTIPATSA